MALAGRVLDEPRVARAEHVLGAVAQTDLELAGENDDELTARCGVPVEELARPATRRNVIWLAGSPLSQSGFALSSIVSMCAC